MSRTQAVKYIYDNIEGGLPRAIEIYNYLSCYGELEVTEEKINNYFKMM